MPSITVDLSDEIVNMDSFDLDKEIAYTFSCLDQEDPIQLRWLSTLLLDKALRIEGEAGGNDV